MVAHDRARGLLGLELELVLEVVLILSAPSKASSFSWSSRFGHAGSPELK